VCTSTSPVVVLGTLACSQHYGSTTRQEHQIIRFAVAPEGHLASTVSSHICGIVRAEFLRTRLRRPQAMGVMPARQPANRGRAWCGLGSTDTDPAKTLVKHSHCRVWQCLRQRTTLATSTDYRERRSPRDRDGTDRRIFTPTRWSADWDDGIHITQLWAACPRRLPCVVTWRIRQMRSGRGVPPLVA